MRVFVAGASGLIGTAIVRKLHAAGHSIGALGRDEARMPWFDGMTMVVGDILDEPNVIRDKIVAFEPDVIVNELTAIPDRINPRRVNKDLWVTNRLRVMATKTLAEAGLQSGAQLISQSIAFAYDPRVGAGPHVESDPLYLDCDASFQPMIEAVAILEELTLGVPRSIVLRYGNLYGEGTMYSKKGAMVEDLQLRKLPIIGGGRGVFSFIHVDDAATATVAALGRPGGTYNIVDDKPLPVSEWLPRYAEFYRTAQPLEIPGWLGAILAGPYGMYLMTQQRGASNARARATFEWTPRFPDAYTGWVHARYG